MAIGYGPAGLLGVKPQNIVYNVVVRYVGAGPGGLAAADRDFTRMTAGYQRAMQVQERAAKSAQASHLALQRTQNNTLKIAEREQQMGRAVTVAQRDAAIASKNAAVSREASTIRVMRAQETLTRVVAKHGAASKKAEIASRSLANVEEQGTIRVGRALGVEAKARERVTHYKVQQNIATKEYRANLDKEAIDTERVKRANEDLAKSYLAVNAERRKAALHAVGNVAIGAGAVALGTMYETGKMAASWESQQQQIRANTRMNDPQWRRAVAMSSMLGTQSGDPRANILQSYRYLSDVGIVDTRRNRNAATSYVRNAMMLALPTGADLQDTTKAMRTLQQAFGFGPSRGGQLANWLHTSSQLSGVNMQDIVRGVPRIAAYASQAGQREAPNMLAFYAALSRIMPAGQASTATARLYQSLVMPKPDQMKRITQFDQTTGSNLSDYISLQGVRRYGITGVLRNIERIRNQTHMTNTEMGDIIPGYRAQMAALLGTGPAAGALRDISGAMGSPAAMRRHGVVTVNENYQRYLKTSATQMKILKENANQLGATIGATVLPQFNALLKFLIPIVQKFAAWAKQHPQLIAGILRIAVVMGGMVAAARAVMMVANAIRVLTIVSRILLISSPWGWVILGISLLVMFYMQSKTFRNAVNGIVGAVVYTATHLKKRLGDLVDWIKNNWKTVLIAAFLGTFLAIPLLVYKFRDQIWTTIKTGLGWISNFVSGSWKTMLVGAFMTIFGPIGLVVALIIKWKTQIWNFFTTVLTAIAHWIGNNWKTLLLVAFTGIFGIMGVLAVQIWNHLPTQWKKVATNAIGGFIHGIESEASKVLKFGKKIAEWLINGLHDWWNSHDPISWAKGKIHDLVNLLPFHGGSGGPTSGGSSIFGMFTKGQVSAPVELGPANWVGQPYFQGTPAAGHADIQYKAGTSIWAPGLNKGDHYHVEFAGYETEGGNTIAVQIVNKKGKVVGHYNLMHLSTIASGISSGSNFGGGAYLGKSGNTGAHTTGAHLHFGFDTGAQSYFQKEGYYVPGGFADYAQQKMLYPSASSGVGGKYGGLINQIARRYHVSPALISSVIQSESGFNPRAVSYMGAKGLMQLMPGTFASQGVGNNPFDPVQNIMAGVKYLMSIFNGPGMKNWPLTLAMYNAGPGAKQSTLQNSIAVYSTPILNRVGGHGGSDSGPAHGGSGGYPAPRTRPAPVSTTMRQVLRNGRLVTQIGIKGADNRIHWYTPPPSTRAYLDPKTHQLKYEVPVVDPKTGAVLWYKPDAGATGPQAGQLRLNRGTGLEQIYQPQTTMHGISVPAGWANVGGQTRYNKYKGYVEEYVPTAVVNGRPTGWHWVPMPGQTYMTQTGALKQYFPEQQVRDPRTGRMIPQSAGWRTVLSPDQTHVQQYRRGKSYLNALLPGEEQQFPAHPSNLALMMPKDRQQWLQGRLKIDKQREQVSIYTARILAIQEHWTPKMLQNVIDQAKQTRRTADATAKRAAQDALYGGLGKGGYQAYHILRDDRCSAEAVANTTRKQTAENTKSIAKSTKDVAKGVHNIGERSAVVATQARKASKPKSRSKARLPIGHGRGHEPTDPRAHGGNVG